MAQSVFVGVFVVVVIVFGGAQYPVYVKTDVWCDGWDIEKCHFSRTLPFGPLNCEMRKIKYIRIEDERHYTNKESILFEIGVYQNSKSVNIWQHAKVRMRKLKTSAFGEMSHPFTHH